MQQEGLNPFEETLDSPSTPIFTKDKSLGIATGGEKLSFDSIAKRLLDENLVLTALELHTELLESGKELKRLRDFFSNPSNFECQTAAQQQGESVRNNLRKNTRFGLCAYQHFTSSFYLLAMPLANC